MARWVQKITPNLDDNTMTVSSGGKLLYDWFGWCLAVTDKQFGVSPFAATAQIAWNQNNTKHQDRNMPDGVYVPIWFTGDKDGYGHVAVGLRQGNSFKVWSSPYTHKPYFDRFEGTVDTVIARMIAIGYGKAFLGWTETLGDRRIVAWEEDAKVEEPKPSLPAQDKPVDTPSKPEPEPEPTPEPAKPAAKKTIWQIIIDFIIEVFTRKEKK